MQLVVLPHVFPGFHAGHGLLIGGDWLDFHRVAAELADQIRVEGWAVSTLRPDGQAPAGIAAAIYALTVPEPWTLIPLSAAAHAAAALVLLRIVLVFLPDWRQAIWAVLPFFLYPSAMTWFTQIHKDGWFILGTYCFLYGWLWLAAAKTWQGPRWWPLAGILWIFTGAALIWLVRPYGVQILQGVAALVAVGLTAVFVARGWRTLWTWQTVAMACLACWAIIPGLTPFTRGGLEDMAPPARGETPPAAGAEVAPRPASEHLLRLYVAGAARRLLSVQPAAPWEQLRRLTLVGGGLPAGQRDRSDGRCPVRSVVGGAGGEAMLPAGGAEARTAGASRTPSPGATHYVLNQEIAGWLLVGIDADEATLLRDEPVELKVYWLPPPGVSLEPSADFYRLEDGRWVQVVRQVVNRVADGGSKRTPVWPAFPRTSTRRGRRHASCWWRRVPERPIRRWFCGTARRFRRAAWSPTRCMSSRGVSTCRRVGSAARPGASGWATSGCRAATMITWRPTSARWSGPPTPVSGWRRASRERAGCGC